MVGLILSPLRPFRVNCGKLMWYREIVETLRPSLGWLGLFLIFQDILNNLLLLHEWINSGKRFSSLHQTSRLMWLTQVWRLVQHGNHVSQRAGWGKSGSI